jgi:hypothetical protein
MKPIDFVTDKVALCTTNGYSGSKGSGFRSRNGESCRLIAGRVSPFLNIWAGSSWEDAIFSSWQRVSLRQAFWLPVS